MSSKMRTAVPDIDRGDQVYYHFMDSGAYSLRTHYVLKQGLKGTPHEWKNYKTKEFRIYMDKYAEFVKKHKLGVDEYVNLDVIYNPEMSWDNLKYLENEHGLSPVPVIHFGEPMKWVEKHLDAGYKFIGLNGLIENVSFGPYFGWADQAFDLICDTPDRRPAARVHGFAMTSLRLMRRYPWWSVDSTSWMQNAIYGKIYVPRRHRGKWIFNKNAFIVRISDQTKGRRGDGFCSQPPMAQKNTLDWLEYIGVPFGKEADNPLEVVEGVLTSTPMRRKANIMYFEHFRKDLPEWPWPFIRPTKGRFDI